MTKIEEKAPKYFIRFKRKDRRPNKIDDKFELFRSIIGLEDTRDILDLYHYTGSHMTDPIQKDRQTVTDINSYQLPIVIARLTPDQVSRLRRDPNVEQVAPDGVAFAAQQPGQVQGQQTIPWGHTKVRAAQAWQVTGKKGDGVNVAVIDTGCHNTHPELSKAVIVNQNFTIESNHFANDGDVHGTHVMGTIVMANNTEGFVGVAPNAKGWNLKAGAPVTPLGPGQFNATDWLEALEYAKTNNAPIVNMSIATPDTPPSTAWAQPIADSIKDGYDRLGIIFPSAMGNQGNANSNPFPANAYGTWGISNLRIDNNLSASSNSGVAVDFTAPGHDIWSSVGAAGYFMHDGTSMATPHISGIAALALSVFKDTGCPPYGAGLKKNKVVGGAFRLAVNKLGKFTTERDNRYGYGMPEADKVVRAMMGMTLS